MTGYGITFEQIGALMAGQRVVISYSSLEEHGMVEQHELELIPPIEND